MTTELIDWLGVFLCWHWEFGTGVLNSWGFGHTFNWSLVPNRLHGQFTSWGASGAWRVHWSQLAWFSLVLGDTDDSKDVSGQWHDERPMDTWVESLISRWRRETFLPMLVMEPAEYPKPDQDDASRETLLPEERNENPPPNAPPPQKKVLFCPLPGQIHDLKWWLMKIFADNVDIFHMYAKMGNDEHTEMQLKFQDLRNPSVSITTPKVGGTGPNLTATDHEVIAQKLWVLNEQQQAFAQVVWLGQIRVPHTWLPNTSPGGYNNHTSNLHQPSGVVQMSILHGFMSSPKITTSIIYQILEPREDHSKRLTKNGDKLQSDDPLILEC